MPFKKGQIANPKGRAPGTRSTLEVRFDRALLADFEKNGEMAIERLRQENPDRYLALCAQRLPKDVHKVDVTETHTHKVISISDTDSLLRDALGIGESSDTPESLPH